MTVILNALISAILQTGILLLIAFAIYVFTARRKTGFRAYLGLTAAPGSALLIAAGLAVAGAALLLAIPAVREMAGGEGTVAGELAASAGGGVVFAAILIKAWLATAASEEIFFRGLLGKRLYPAFGFHAGNLIQAVLFGLVHLLLLLTGAALAVVLGLIAFTALFGWISGYLNEKTGQGSIAPGWVMHGLANTLAYSAVAFL